MEYFQTNYCLAFQKSFSYYRRSNSLTFACHDALTLNRSLPAPESAEAEDKSFCVAGKEFVCGPLNISTLSEDIVS